LLTLLGEIIYIDYIQWDDIQYMRSQTGLFFVNLLINIHLEKELMLK